MSYPSEAEKKLVTRFRSRVFDILKPGEDRSDQFLIKWIRAEGGNLEKAELHMRKSFEWRREHGTDEILNEPWDPFMLENYPCHIRSRDNYGHPVMELPMGIWDLGKIVGEGKESEFLRHSIKCFELMVQKVRDSNIGRQPWEFQNTQVTVIVDWQGYSYAQLVNWKAVQMLLKFATVFDLHYPEVLYRAFYINCPSMFPKLYAMLKPTLRDRTRRRIKIYGTRKEQWEPKIKRLVHVDQLAQNYGGNLPRLY